jgi:sodium ion-translocating decarboxylase beta subunit
MEVLTDALSGIWSESGFYLLAQDWRQPVMLLLACVLLYLGIVKKFEPLLLVGIAFGMLLTNLPGAGLYHPELWDQIIAHTKDYSDVLTEGGLLDILYIGVKTGLYPALVFMGIGAMTDFGPLLANPKSMLMGAAAQLGIYGTFLLAVLLGFTGPEGAAIGNTGGACGPTAVYLASMIAPHLLGAIAITAYSYMALIPLIQPPLMRLLTTQKEREIKMEQPRQVQKREKILFPIVVTLFAALLLPSVAPLLGFLMLGNLLRECGGTSRLANTAEQGLMNTVIILLSVSVGATTTYDRFLTLQTITIVALGLFAFALSTVGGLLMGKLLCKMTGGKINPLIGSAGVAAVPMAARVSQLEGQRADPGNFLLMHAMGPNVAGVIGSAVAAGFLLQLFG